MEAKRHDLIWLIGAIILFSFFLIQHMDMTIVSDDLYWADTLSGLSFSGILSQMAGRATDMGKIFTDNIGIILHTIPFTIWKIINPLAFVLIAILIAEMINSQNKIIVFVMTMFLPLAYLASAGYIMTSSNYVYPMLSLLLLLRPLYLLLNRKNVNKATYIVSLLAIPLTCNQDQYAMIVIGGLLLTLIYFLVNRKDDRRIINCILLLLVSSILVYIGLFLLPGHMARINDDSEMLHWLPQYQNWSLLKKIYKGYTTTVAVLILNKQPLYVITVIIIGSLALFAKKLHYKLIGLIPLTTSLIIKAIGSSRLVSYYDYACGMPDFSAGSGIYGILAFLLSLVSIVSLVLSICFLVEDSNRKLILLLLCFLGLMSRFMMGLSATIYASSYRTFFPLLFILVIMNSLLLMDNRFIKEHKQGVLTVLLIGAYILL